MAAKEKCWVWFKNGLAMPGTWNSGWYGSPSPLSGVLIENFDDVTCRVPEWWVAWKKPADFKEGPEIPEGAEWKLFPTGLK